MSSVCNHLLSPKCYVNIYNKIFKDQLIIILFMKIYAATFQEDFYKLVLFCFVDLSLFNAKFKFVNTRKIYNQ